MNAGEMNNDIFEKVSLDSFECKNGCFEAFMVNKGLLNTCLKVNFYIEVMTVVFFFFFYLVLEIGKMRTFFFY